MLAMFSRKMYLNGGIIIQPKVIMSHERVGVSGIPGGKKVQFRQQQVKEVGKWLSLWSQANIVNTCLFRDM